MYVSQWHTNTHSTRDPKFATAIWTRDRHWNYLDVTNCYREGTNRTTHTHMRDITLSPRRSWDLRSSRLLHNVGWFGDVLELHIGTISKGQDVQKRILNLESWTDTLSRNIDNKYTTRCNPEERRFIQPTNVSLFSQNHYSLFLNRNV
jgi:hypothetical protein